MIQLQNRLQALSRGPAQALERAVKQQSRQGTTTATPSADRGRIAAGKHTKSLPALTMGGSAAPVFTPKHASGASMRSSVDEYGPSSRELPELGEAEQAAVQFLPALHSGVTVEDGW